MTDPIARRLAGLDWNALERDLWERGYARTQPVLTPEECRALRASYEDDRRFRKTVDMRSHGFGDGEYRYFRDPLPKLVSALRTHTYRRLAPVANRMEAALRRPTRFPATLREMRALCASRGQPHPTPLLLRYGPGGYNALHRDLYGPLVFPIQLACFLSRPGADYDGGAFLLVEQRPRAQSVGDALLPGQGEIVLFASAERPRRGARGFHRAGLRHGVATVTRGERYTLGVIFHDAKS
ncbi:MAG: 2OG-Fe(II) oxygenase [Myxococcota bacterium]|nr:2OG-Fe(II) oxygenase [Myxococcota bacterium]